MAQQVTDRAKGTPSRRPPVLVEIYRSAVGKKYVMAVTGIVLMGYVLAHMIGNLKLYFGQEEFDHYAHFLRELLYPIVPQSATLWIMRIALLAAVILHIAAAYQLTVMNRQARPDAYRAKRDFVAADFAARTMRWTGVIVLLFVLYHLADLTFHWVNPAGAGATPYERVVASFENPAVAAFYLASNLALGVHLYHGGWSLFQSMGWNHRQLNHWRRSFAIAFALIVTLGNLSFPLAVQLGIVS